LPFSIGSWPSQYGIGIAIVIGFFGSRSFRGFPVQIARLGSLQSPSIGSMNVDVDVHVLEKLHRQKLTPGPA